MFIERKKQKYFNDYLDRLVNHPFQEVERTQDFARHKQIRRATNQQMLRIGKGAIAIPDGFKIEKTKRGWRILTK